MAHIIGSEPFQVTPLTDFEVAQRICAAEGTYEDRVYNTFLVLRTIRTMERRACEIIARESGSARAADMIRDRYQDDDKR